MESLALNDCLGDRFTLFETVEKRVRGRTREELESTLQYLLYLEIEKELSRGKREKREVSRDKETRFYCIRFGTKRASSFLRNGSYSRRLGTEAGSITLKVPKLRCICGGNVRLDTKVFFKGKRLWYDLYQRTVELKGLRVSFREKRIFLREELAHPLVFPPLSLLSQRSKLKACGLRTVP
ncbi:MAG: transposase, partial [Actinomycetota bacterium]|nr:transposase [Actinomycetota bacterium]